MKKLRAILIDDEEDSLTSLELLLGNSSDFISIIGKAKGVVKGLIAIQKLKPDVVFLDVSMPDGTGFDLLDAIGAFEFDLVFVTAHNDFAIPAIRKNALDYLTKPVDQDELESTIEKLKSKYVLNSKLNSDKSRLLIKTTSGVEVININEVLYCKAEGSYTSIFLKNNRIVFVSKNLKSINNELYPNPFLFRCHRSYIVNIKEIESYLEEDGAFVVLRDKSRIPVSYTKRDKIFEMLK